MKALKLTVIILFSTLVLSAQLSLQDSVIVTAVFDENYVPIKNADKKISRLLMQLSLDQLVEKELIKRENMGGFSLPLGIQNNSSPINFTKGMIDMWQAKASFVSQKSDSVKTDVFNSALKAINENLSPNGKMQLLDFRERLIVPEIKHINALHKEMTKNYNLQREKFMNIIINAITPNSLIGYNIQELLPPTHMIQSGKIRSINPLFKVYYYDLLLREAGTSFIQYFPARYDVRNSFGPFQFTEIAIEDINVNNRLIDIFYEYKSMNDLIDTGDHIRLAVLFLYNNWERLSYSLDEDKTIKKFNKYFKDYEKDEVKRRELQIFVAGITACMHHRPGTARKIIRNYLSDKDDLDDIHTKLIKASDNKQLQKYYRSSSEAYLIMEVYDALLNEFEKK